MPEAVIIATARTPIGRAYKGSLVDVRADDLAGFAINALMEKAPAVDRSTVDDVMVGCALTHHEQGFNPSPVPPRCWAACLTVSRRRLSTASALRLYRRFEWHFMQSSLVKVTLTWQQDRESVSRTYGKAFDSDDLNPRFTDTERDDFINNVYIPMGNTAENVAKKYGVTRERMDEFAKRSQDRAVESQKNGFFDSEITSIELPDGRVIRDDDGPRPNTTLEKLASLPPAFEPDGRVTAGNSCPLNDGAAAVLVMSDVRAVELGLEPIARIIGSAVAGLEPEYMGVGPIYAVRNVLDQTGMSLDDIDVVELNEAFAAQVLASADELGIDMDKLNPHGGAIALGHPFGMTGARIMGTLLNDLQTLDGTYGLETMCVGGGQGMAMIVERLN